MFPRRHCLLDYTSFIERATATTFQLASVFAMHIRDINRQQSELFAANKESEGSEKKVGDLPGGKCS